MQLKSREYPSPVRSVLATDCTASHITEFLGQLQAAQLADRICCVLSVALCRDDFETRLNRLDGLGQQAQGAQGDGGFVQGDRACRIDS